MQNIHVHTLSKLRKTELFKQSAQHTTFAIELRAHARGILFSRQGTGLTDILPAPKFLLLLPL